MIKGKMGTLLPFFLSVMLAAAGWMFTQNLFRQKEADMLARNGELTITPSNTDMFDNSSVSEIDNTDDITIKTNLSEAEMADILSVWEPGGKKLPHEPKTGQINMEQAIGAGKNWILDMEEKESDFDEVEAKLCTPEMPAGKDDVMYGYWTVEFAKDDALIRLTIHAVTGEIWRADITYIDDNQLDAYTDDVLLQMAFPFIEGGSMKKIKINSTTYESLVEGLVYAAVKRSSTVVEEQEPMIQIHLWLCTSTEIRES